MKQRICPHCQNEIRPLNINELDGVAECDHCGKKEKVANLLEKENEGLATEQVHTNTFDTPNPPPNALTQVSHHSASQLTLHLPSDKKGCYIAVLVFMLFFAFPFVFVFGLLAVADDVNIPLGTAAIVLISMTPLLIIGVAGVAIFNKAFRRESLHIDDQQLVLEAHNPIPIYTKGRRQYDLSHIREVGFDRAPYINDPTKKEHYSLFLATEDHYDQFFNHENAEGKEWLAHYLNQNLIRDNSNISQTTVNVGGSNQNELAGVRGSAENKANATFAFPKPPSYAYTKLQENQHGTFTLLLPQIGFDIRAIAISIFSVFFLTFMVIINFTLVFFLFFLPILAIFLYIGSSFFRSEELTIENDQLTLTDYHPIRFLAKPKRTFNLEDIHRVAYSEKLREDTDNAGRSNTGQRWYIEYNLYLVLANNFESFFDHETPKGKKWLAEQLNNIVGNDAGSEEG